MCIAGRGSQGATTWDAQDNTKWWFDPINWSGVGNTPSDTTGHFLPPSVDSAGSSLDRYADQYRDNNFARRRRRGLRPVKQRSEFRLRWNLQLSDRRLRPTNHWCTVYISQHDQYERANDQGRSAGRSRSEYEFFSSRTFWELHRVTKSWPDCANRRYGNGTNDQSRSWAMGSQRLGQWHLRLSRWHARYLQQPHQSRYSPVAWKHSTAPAALEN